jgi:hypothetical protein
VPVLLLVGVVVLVVAALATGLAWPGWMRQEIAGTPSAAVDRSTPDGTARGVVAAFNRRDVQRFVDELVCRDGRTPTDDGDAIADGAQLRLNAPVDTFGDGDASVQIWHTVGGQERRAPGFMKQESDGWCVFALALQG